MFAVAQPPRVIIADRVIWFLEWAILSLKDNWATEDRPSARLIKIKRANFIIQDTNLPSSASGRGGKNLKDYFLCIDYLSINEQGYDPETRLLSVRRRNIHAIQAFI